MNNQQIPDNIPISVYIPGIVPILLSNSWTRKMLIDANIEFQKSRSIPSIIINDNDEPELSFINNQLMFLCYTNRYPMAANLDIGSRSINIKSQDLVNYCKIIDELIEICDVVLAKIKVDSFPKTNMIDH